ncbi:hypothetical protein ABPG73_017146 [Tetrahymena malaccensis]
MRITQTQLKQQLFKKQNLRINVILIMLLISKVVCQDNLHIQNQITELSCDENITRQLDIQNIQYQCESSIINIYNQQEFILDLILKDLEIQSKIYIFNINTVNISNIILDNFKFNEEVVFSRFISINQVNNLNIQNISISNCLSSKVELIYAKINNNVNINYLALSNLYVSKSIQIISQNVFIDKAVFQNSIACELLFNGQLILKINYIHLLINKQYDHISGQNLCFQEYTTNKQIEIQNIFIDINQKHNEPFSFFKFAKIYQTAPYRDTKITIHQIQYQSQFILSEQQKLILQLGSNDQQNTDLLIQRIIFHQTDSISFMQILFQTFENVVIEEVNIHGNLYSPAKENNYNNIMSIVNIKNFIVSSIIIKQHIDGIIFLGQDIQRLQIKQLEMQSGVQISQNFIDLQNCIEIEIQNIVAYNLKLGGYLINAYSIQVIYIRKMTLSDINFNQYSLFNLINILYASFQDHQITNMKPKLYQSTIFYIEQQIQYYYDQQMQVFYFSTQADLLSDQNLQFLNLNGYSTFLQIKETQIINGSSTTFGGCINFIQSDNGQSELILYDSKFINCKSKYSGGAIAGIKKIDISISNFEQCSSQIGGALYVIQDDQFTLDQNYFKQNIGYLAANNYNQNNIDLEVDEIYEIIETNDNKQLTKVDQFLYPGLTYLIKIKIKADGEWHNTFNNKNYFGNIYDLLINPSSNFLSLTPHQLINTNFPFLLWYAIDIPFNDKQTIIFEDIFINFVIKSQLKFDSKYQIYNGCKKQGMEQIYLDNQKFVCKYCDFMKASYDGVCENCLTDYFSTCYGNYSVLKQSYWRSNYTVNASDIYFCSNNPQSCQGGSSVGNDLCFEGHIGAQCLGCDINGNYWQEKYSQVGYFQCVKCSSISSNTNNAYQAYFASTQKKKNHTPQLTQVQNVVALKNSLKYEALA